MTLLKVRVWCQEDNQMTTANDYRELSELFSYLDSDDSFFSEPMYSIGLFDEDGTEIFENDIVVAYDDDGVTRLCGVVIYKDNTYCLQDGYGIYNPLWVHAEHFEVVGNIYENPELFETERRLDDGD